MILNQNDDFRNDSIRYYISQSETAGTVYDIYSVYLTDTCNHGNGS